MGGYSDDLSDHCVFGLIFLQNWLTQFTNCSLLSFESWVRLRHFSLFFYLLTNWAISQNVHSKLSLVICPFLICSVLPKDHTKVIIVSAWLRNSSIYNIIRWFAGMPGQTNHQPSVWCSKHYLFSLFLIDLGHSKLRVPKTPFFIIKKFKNELKFFLKWIL